MPSRLRYIFYILRYANIVLIVYSIIKVEFTLNYNHVASVLGENGRIFFPSQLIPTVIGACSLVRVCYIRWETWRSQNDYRPSLAHTPTSPTVKTTLPFGRIGKIFAPATQTDMEARRIEKYPCEDNTLDEGMVGQPLWWRLLVSWLPWLQAASVWWKTKNGVEEDELPQNAPPVGNTERNTTNTGIIAQQERRDTLDSEYTLAASPTSAVTRKTSAKTEFD